ncbi:LON peptidase substrate-binding domain-containing protein [Nocardiopsis kunsanensis]|uniref:LON peptidase substrate-binding domain-containing protein n=1 Tax=Nocardiopsis kunsanensis TaxID=141693 RepID=UPI0004776ECD|nr:LON peptidase substrate-binding domain-containing protein [Nocardiopsis kunsanensis]
MPVALPLFPLNTVLFPGMSLPLHVFEPRYRRLITEVVDQAAETADEPERNPRRFGVVWIELGHEVTGESGQRSGGTDPSGRREDAATALPRISATGCTALVRDLRTYEDGRYDLVVEGGTRFRIDDVSQVDTSSPQGYANASVSLLAEPMGPDAEEHAERVRELFDTYCQRLAAIGMTPEHMRELPKDPIALSYTVAATVVLDQPEKQRMLEAEDAATRLAVLARFLRRENRIVAAPTLHNLPAGPFLDHGVSYN